MEEITLIRSRRKTLTLAVTREGKVVVRAPLGVSEDYVRSFVSKHERWIKERLAQAQARPRLSLNDGDALVLFGSTYYIKEGRARISEGEIFLPLEGREAALRNLLKRFALEVMRQITSRIAARYGFSYRTVRISTARGRWGSCNREGVIAYTFRIAFLSPPLAEYVAVHELAHTVVFNHSAEFWDIVDSILPDRKERRKALKGSDAMNFL